MTAVNVNMLDKKLFKSSISGAVKKLNPKEEIRNPVMFVTWVGAILTSIIFIIDLLKGAFSGFEFQIALWLWFTVLFANFAEAIAEGQGKAMAEALSEHV
jgi:K+-transporting ATPase ATPase B chain